MHIASDDLMCAVVSVSQVAMDLLHLHIDRWYPQCNYQKRSSAIYL